MKQINHRDYLLVEVPLSAQGISFSKFAHVPKERLEWWIDTFTGSEYDCIDLPPGSYEIIGKGNEISGNQWEEILYPNIHEDYTKEKQYLFSAKNSGLSLIKSHGMKPSETLILKLKNDA